MKKQTTLRLKVETVRRLTADQLRAANGGRYWNVCTTAGSYCQCDTSSTYANSHCCNDIPPANEF